LSIAIPEPGRQMPVATLLEDRAPQGGVV